MEADSRAVQHVRKAKIRGTAEFSVGKETGDILPRRQRRSTPTRCASKDSSAALRVIVPIVPARAIGMLEFTVNLGNRDDIHDTEMPGEPQW